MTPIFAAAYDGALHADVFKIFYGEDGHHRRRRDHRQLRRLWRGLRQDRPRGPGRDGAGMVFQAFDDRRNCRLKLLPRVHH